MPHLSREQFCAAEDGSEASAEIAGTLVLGGTTPGPSAPATAVRRPVTVRPSPSPPPCHLQQLTAEERSFEDALAASGFADAIRKDATTIHVYRPGTVPPVPLPDPAPLAPVEVHGPDDVAYWRVCDGQITQIVWVHRTSSAKTPPPNNPGAGPNLVTSALAGKIQAPKLSIGVSPAQFGITGLESYFWLTGYDGGTVSTTVDTPPYRIDLRATPTYYAWDFGDGPGVTTTSLGLPYPQVSPIRHTYDVRSDRSPLAVNGVYRVRVTAHFDTMFRVIGPAVPPDWVDFTSLGLQPLTATGEWDYKVVEVAAVLTVPSPGG